MSKHLKSARAKLAKGDFTSMSPMEMVALAKFSAGIDTTPQKSRMLPQLIEAILDITKVHPHLRDGIRTELHSYLEDRVAVQIEKVWTAEDFRQVK